MAQQLADQRQTDVFAVLVAVADDAPALAVGEAQHRHQLRLAAGLQADADLLAVGGAQQFLHHAALLVHLDGIDRRVAAAVVVRPHGLGEGAAQARHPVAQDAAEAHQHRQGQSRVADLVAQGVQVDAVAAARRKGVQVAVVGDVEIAAAPVGKVVDIAGLLDVVHERPFTTETRSAQRN